jgi:N-acetylmuramoyl-L-alanine amidase
MKNSGWMRLAPAVLAWAVVSGAGADAAAQATPPELRIERENGSVERVAPATSRGFASVPLAVLSRLGWRVEERPGGAVLTAGDRATIALRTGTPFFAWGAQTLQLADAPYRDADETWVPLQLVTDFFPERLPQYFEYDAASRTLRAGNPGARTLPAPQATANAGTAPAAGAGEALPSQPTPYDGVRVVWIDAGHGGADPGAIGRGGTREKDIALAISRKLSAILRDEDRLEVRLTREGDGFVDLWERGLLATEAKGERPGVFVSIHANSFPARRETRGFETYFLSEARTDDERRVSAVENAPLSIRGRGLDAARPSDLDFILRELRNFDHQHWSALLAEMVQGEFAKFHPGPNRGVKQGPLAVLTNSLMPSVLVEVGFVTNDDEARLMTQESFQDRAAAAMATAILRFLERYPPGNGLGDPR